MPIKLYVDDVRRCPDGWELARNIREAIRLVEANKGQITDMSLDHDLGLCYCIPCLFSNSYAQCLDDNGAPTCGCICHAPEPTGYDFLKWVHETGNWPTNEPTIHSANPIGSQRMRLFIQDFGSYNEKR